ncbi:hypothetical protein [uncultured Massilia sp.]|uniref:hypothetical protein n=1 Tax=uncultured Massilia sp. TaxID=169973 RepID=UPI0025D80611|nr:hypothetical protein [uncultured Massilia sp.]
MPFSTAGWRFPVLLLLCFVLGIALRPVSLSGDVVEYATDTVAMAAHGTPDIRLDDIARTRRLAPPLTEPLNQLEQGMRRGDRELYAAFVRGRDDKVYPIHFFGYPALAAVPFLALDALGIDPLRAFQVVNYAAVLVLALALRRFFRSDVKAALALLLFFACGGGLYINWTSPECVSAAGLLAALLFLLSGAPLAAGLLGGVAALQNPTIVFFFAFGPLIKLWLEYRREASFGANLKAQLTPANLTGLAAGLAVFALPVLFNFYQYGVPNIIAKKFSDPHFVGMARLVSFFFDLNQGMILAIPGVAVLLAAWGWSRRAAGTLALCLLFTLALALPALAVQNWNSGAAGVMRYAFWAAMPLLLALLLRVRERARWPVPLVAGLALVQAAAMAHAVSYTYVQMSPLARLAMRVAPQWYHPEPEIFAERMGHNDDYIRPAQAYAFRAGAMSKTLYFPAEPASIAQLCGSDGALAPDNAYVDSAYGWRYIDGPVRCMHSGLRQRTLQAAQFRDRDGIALDAGWSGVEFNGGAWNGAWSQGARSRLVLAPAAGADAGARPASLTLLGQYLDGNRRTRVRIDGVDLGWQELDRPVVLALPAGPAGAPVTIELEHEAPHAPGPGDTRALAFFLREVRLHEDPSLAHR